MNSRSSAVVNGIAANITDSNTFATFTIATINTDALDYLTTRYKIVWSNPDNLDQHGGYYLDYTGRTGGDGSFERNGGPIWWSYASSGRFWRPWQDWGQGNLSIPNDEYAYHEMLFQFTSKTSWEISMDDGTTWYNVP